MRPLGDPLRARLRGLLDRTERLFESATMAAQTGAVTAQWLDEARTAVREAIAATLQLEASLATLEPVGL